jgi:hypothetical protein
MLKEIHHCEVGGRTLEAANVHALREKVGRLLESIAPGRTLPLCYFRVPAMDYELPVYEEGGEFSSPVVGGPRLRASDLAGMRRRVCRYLVNAGYVAEPHEVTVSVLRPRDLRQVPPAAVFRSQTDPDFWMPSVEGISADGPVVGILGEATRLRGPERRRATPGPAGTIAKAPAAPDVIELLRFLRTELARSRSAVAAAGIYATEVRPEIWAAARRSVSDTGRRLVAYLAEDGAPLELAISRTGFGELAVALEDRGISIFLGPTEDALAEAVGAYLSEEGFLRFASEIELHDVPQPREERLGVDSIWTFGEEPGEVPALATDEPEEVRNP